MITRFTISLACVAALAIGVSAGPKQRKASEPPEVIEIRAVLDRQVEAWNRRDLEAFMHGYWNSDQLSFYSGGTKTSGWQATIDRYRKTYQGEGREMGRLDFSDVQIEMLGPVAAFVRGRWHLKMANSEPGGLFTLIFRKLQGRWQIVHDHTGSA
jgi:ketosteroid isomerase-like protein